MSSKKLEKELAEEAAIQLKEAGFLVEVDAVVESGRRGRTRRADLLVWAVRDGQLQSALVVEVVAGGVLGRSGQKSLEQLLSLKSAHPGAALYLYDGSWHRVDGIRLVEAPAPSLGDASESLPVLESPALDGLAARVLFDAMVAAPEKSGDEGSLIAQVLREVLRGGSSNELANALLSSPRGRNAFARKVHVALMRSKQSSSMGVPLSLSTAMARLLAPERSQLDESAAVFDPWCGVGSTLLGVGEWTAELQARPLLLGIDGVTENVGVAEGLLSLAGHRASSSLGAGLELERESHDFIVSVPPLGVKFDKEQAREFGTRNLEVAAIRRIVAALKPGGRAVIATGAGFLFREERAFAALREELATTKRVVAAVELPGGALETTHVSMCLLVVENASPRPTLTARLADDWEEQLAADGAFFAAYRQHLEESP